MTSLPNVPYETAVEDGCAEFDCFRGIFPDVFHELRRIMNFTFTLRAPEDGQWGARDEEGEWSGIIGWEIIFSCGK